MKKKKFEPTKRCISRIGFKNYIFSRFVTIGQIKEGLSDGPMDIKACKNIRQFIGSILFNARYVAGKAVFGYDFI